MLCYDAGEEPKRVHHSLLLLAVGVVVMRMTEVVVVGVMRITEVVVVGLFVQRLYSARDVELLSKQTCDASHPVALHHFELVFS